MSSVLAVLSLSFISTQAAITLPFTQSWTSLSDLNAYTIMNEGNGTNGLTISNNQLTATFPTGTVWWKEQMNALYIYQTISLTSYPSFAITTITKARSETDMTQPILSGYHYGGPMIRNMSSTVNDFVFIAVGFSSDCSQTVPCTEDKSTINDNPTINKEEVTWTTDPGDAQLRICKFGDVFKAYSRSNNDATEAWREDGSWTRADLSAEDELEIGIMGFSFYNGGTARYYWGDMVIEEITGFDDCLNSAWNAGDGSNTIPSTTVMQTDDPTIDPTMDPVEDPTFDPTADPTDMPTYITVMNTADIGTTSMTIIDTIDSTDTMSTEIATMDTTNNMISTENTMTTENPYAPDCLVGDIMYSDGDSIGYIGKTCTDDINFTGTESFCRNGVIEDEVYSSDCETQSSGSKCCQSGAPGSYGGATCITGECDEWTEDMSTSEPDMSTSEMGNTDDTDPKGNNAYYSGEFMFGVLVFIHFFAVYFV